MATSSTPSTIPKKTVKDFKFIKEIGNGSYSTVSRRKIPEILKDSNII
jgi:hypothetical protein